MKRALVGLLPFLLSGCLYEPLDGRPSVITRSTEPLYQRRPDGLVAATSCLSGRPSGYARTPSACVVDSTFAAQASDAGHLVHPRAPGPGYAQPVAAAAYLYIYGTPPAGAAGGQAAAGAPPQRIDVAPDAQAEGEPGAGAAPPVQPQQQP